VVERKKLRAGERRCTSLTMRIKRTAFPILVLVFELLFRATFSSREVFAGDGLSDQELAHALDSKFASMSGTAARGRLIGGWTLIGLGVTSGLGAMSTSSSVDPTWRSTAVAFGGLGGAFVTGGTLTLLFPRAAETYSVEYRKMTENSSEEIKKKLISGEHHLAQISKDAEQGRMISGATWLGMGLGYVAWFLLREGDLNYRTYNNGYLLYSGASVAILGLWTFLVKGAEETAYEDYLSYKNQGISYAAKTDRKPNYWNFGFVPMIERGPGGVLSATLSF